MAEEEEPSRPFLVVSDILYNIRLVNNRQDWAKVKCLTRVAYDCGEKGDLIVDGLDLYVRAGREDDPYLHPSLCIGATPGVLISVGSEIDEVMAECYGRDIRLSGSIYTVAGDVIVLRVSFLARHDSSDFRSYYLVYDSAAASLSLLPHELPNCTPLCTTFPLKVGEEDNYSLFIMAESALHPYPFFLTWSPPPEAQPYPRMAIKYKWVKRGWIGKSRICDDARSFQASVLFLYKGSAIWGDLGRGIMYCKCSELNNRGLEPVGKFKYLPRHCRDRYDDDDAPPLTVYRNMGCVGDSIWFVTIEPFYECPGETIVCVWTLDILSEEGQWKTHNEFKMQTIWELDGFRDQGLPETVPKYPILRQQDDGILYMLLPVPSRGRSYAHLVGIDLSSSSAGMRLVVNRRLSIPWMCRPVVVDPDFFSPRHMTV